MNLSTPATRVKASHTDFPATHGDPLGQCVSTLQVSIAIAHVSPCIQNARTFINTDEIWGER